MSPAPGADDPTHGNAYYILDSAGAIKDVKWDTAGINQTPPNIGFMLTGTARNTSITVEYHLFIDPDWISTSELGPDDGAWKTAEKKLTLDITR